MPLDLAKEKITLKQQKGKQTSQILLEGDVIVPDSKPDVKEVLRCQGRVCPEEVKVGEERVAFSGELQISVLYRAAYGEKPVYALTSSLPINDVVQVEGLRKENTVDLSLSLAHLECTIVNDRKIGVKAVVQVRTEAWDTKEVHILEDVGGESVQLLKEKVRVDTPVTEKKDRFTIKNEISLAAEQPNIGEILCEDISVIGEEIRPLEGKISLRGSLPVSVVYQGEEDGMPISVERSIPFSGFVDAPGVMAGTAVDVRLSVPEWSIVPQVDEDGEARIFSVTAVVGADVCATEETEQEWITDAYMPGKKLEIQTEQIELPWVVGRAANEFVQKETVSLETGETPIMQAVATWGKVILGEMVVENDAVVVDGVLQVEILYLCEEDENPVCVITRGYPFTQKIEVKGAKAGDMMQAAAALKEVDFRLTSAREGELRAEIVVDVRVLRQEKQQAVTELSISEEPLADGGAAAVIYTVQAGDSLWSIAKKYQTTIPYILMVNEIENPDLIYPGQKLLILRKKFL